MSPSSADGSPTAIQVRTIQYLLASLVVAMWVVAAAVAGNVPVTLLLGLVSFVLLTVPALEAHVRPNEN